MIIYSRTLALVLVVLTLAACSGRHTDLQNYLEQVRQGAVPAAEPLPQLPELTSVDYVGAAARDPFRPMARSSEQSRDAAAGAARNCPQPNFARVATQLQQIALDQMQLKGVMTAQNGSRTALIITNQGQLHRVTTGDYLGLNYGQVTAISANRLTLREWIATGDGCWQQRETSLTLVTPSRSNNL